jgi:hypothetical protein
MIGSMHATFTIVADVPARPLSRPDPDIQAPMTPMPMLIPAKRAVTGLDYLI